MTDQQINLYIEKLERNLIQAQKQSVELTRNWVNRIPDKSGVYLIYENSKIIYVGETGNLRKRMNDLRNTLNHTLRRTLGAMLFSDRKDFKKATSSIKFPEKIELELEAWMRNNLQNSYLEVKLGRKELEERILERNFRFLNKRTKRK